MDRDVVTFILEALSSMWSGFELWQKIIISAVLFLAFGMAAYHAFVERKDPELIEKKKEGPLAYFGFSNDDLKLGLIGVGLFISVVIAGLYLAAI